MAAPAALRRGTPCHTPCPHPPRRVPVPAPILPAAAELLPAPWQAGLLPPVLPRAGAVGTACDTPPALPAPVLAACRSLPASGAPSLRPPRLPSLPGSRPRAQNRP